MTALERLRYLRALPLAMAALAGGACAPGAGSPPVAPNVAAAASQAPSVSTTQAPAPRQSGGPRYNETPNQYVTVEGTRLAYRTLGSDTGEPPLVCLQHLTGTMDDWDPEVVEGLARGRRVYVFDNAGVGASGGVTPDSVESMAHVAERFVDALHSGKVDILGFSMGGGVAQQFVFNRPAVVRKAIFAGTAPKGGPGVANLPEVVAEAFKRAAKERTHPKTFLFFSETPVGKLAAKEFLWRINKHTVDPDPPVSDVTMQAQMKAILAWTGAPPDNAKLAAITQPVLVVNGSNDIMTPTPASYELYKRIPRAQLVLYPDSGHGALFQYHDAFVREVDAFLRSAQ